MLYSIVAFVGTLCLISLLRKHAHGFGLVDTPSPRKTHLGEILVIGGLAFVIAFLPRQRALWQRISNWAFVVFNKRAHLQRNRGKQ
ncbi:MAG: hypothetical protein ACREVT_14025 [Burkholderiales bacterium]